MLHGTAPSEPPRVATGRQLRRWVRWVQLPTPAGRSVGRSLQPGGRGVRHVLRGRLVRIGLGLRFRRWDVVRTEHEHGHDHSNGHDGGDGRGDPHASMKAACATSSNAAPSRSGSSCATATAPPSVSRAIGQARQQKQVDRPAVHIGEADPTAEALGSSARRGRPARQSALRAADGMWLPSSTISRPSFFRPMRPTKLIV